MKRKAIYAGTFDPVTLGHIDVIERALQLFDEIVIAVTDNPGKAPFFSIDERIALLKGATKKFKRVSVKPFDGLLVDFVKKEKAKIIVRGLREVTDFHAEFRQSIVNRKLAPKVETVFIMTNPKYFYISSSTVKEIALLGGHISGFVPKAVEKALSRKISEQ
ncbi:MAG: pantetheine-phosphate adenylyltransferase [Candidatus Diapherotrites archaeon]